MVHIGSNDPRPLVATIDIDATPEQVWRVISDVRRTSEWSPECRRVVARSPLRVGRFLLGLNRRKAIVWATVSRITEFEADRAISWVVLTNRSVWTYRVEPTDTGSRLTETRETPRGEGRFALWFTRAFLGGQGAHDDELEGGMQAGLDVIRQAVEQAAA
jgi:hypothetical protein